MKIGNYILEGLEGNETITAEYVVDTVEYSVDVTRSDVKQVLYDMTKAGLLYKVEDEDEDGLVWGRPKWALTDFGHKIAKSMGYNM